MQADGIIDRYAIGGAVGATFYREPDARCPAGTRHHPPRCNDAGASERGYPAGYACALSPQIHMRGGAENGLRMPIARLGKNFASEFFRHSTFEIRHLHYAWADEFLLKARREMVANQAARSTRALDR